MPPPTASQVHSVLAAGLNSPSVLQNWLRNSEELEHFHIAPGSLDLEVLWKFAAFANKVRHNDLRRVLPLTFRLMTCLKLDIRIFGDYAAEAVALRNAGTKSLEAKMSSFLDFLRHWLKTAGDDAHALLWSVVCHESTLHQLRQTRQPARRRRSAPALQSLTRNSVPRIEGTLFVRQFAYDPRQVNLALHQQSVDLTGLVRGEYFLGYWRSALTGQKRILNFTRIGAYVLSLIDRSSTVDSILTRIGITPHDTDAARPLLHYLDDLMKVGLIVCERRKATSPCV